MFEVDLTQKSKAITSLAYGPPRAGKTQFAATFPRPLFLSDAGEKGWTTIGNMEPELFYEPDVKPLVWAIDKPTDLLQMIPRIEPLVKSKRVATIVVDSITFYSDKYLTHLNTSGGYKDPRQAYGALANHLTYIRDQIHGIDPDLNVLWLALSKDPGEKETHGGPSIPGQSSLKFGAGCDYILYLRREGRSGQVPTYEIRTQPYGHFPAGGRDCGLLTDPLGTFKPHPDHPADRTKDVFSPGNTYRDLITALDISAPTFPKISATPAGAAAKR